MDLVAGLLGVTLGPKGRNVVLQNKYGPPKIVNDGETVLKEVLLAHHSHESFYPYYDLAQISHMSCVYYLHYANVRSFWIWGFTNECNNNNLLCICRLSWKILWRMLESNW